MHHLLRLKKFNYLALFTFLLIVPSLLIAPFAAVQEQKAEGQCMLQESNEIAQTPYVPEEVATCDLNACIYKAENKIAAAEKKSIKKIVAVEKNAKKKIAKAASFVKGHWAPVSSAKSDALEVARTIYHGIHSMTAYTSEVAQTDASPCTTANGFNVCNHGIEDTIAANFLPFGTKVKIPDLFGDRIFVVRDRMNRRHATRVDVWMKDKRDAMQFGIRKTRILVLK